MCHRCRRIRSVHIQIPTRQRHKLHRVRRQQIPHLLRTPKFLYAVRPELYALVTHSRNVIDRLPIVPSPGDGRIANANVRRCGRDLRIKIRKIHRGIERSRKQCLRARHRPCDRCPTRRTHTS